jgi:hypothetical protein
MLMQELYNGKSVFRCNCCGRIYDEVPLIFGQDEPYDYWLIPEHERVSKVQLGQDLCVIDFDHFFHRAKLVIPIIDYNHDLVFNVWTTISEENFKKRRELWNNPKRIGAKPYYGLLRSLIPAYENTLDLEIKTFEDEVGLLPGIEIAEHMHPLTIDQNNGITFRKAVEIVSNILEEQHNTNKQLQTV